MNLVASGLLLLFALSLTTPLTAGTGIDLHRLWDNRCNDCHGHAGDFARKFLDVSGDQLQGNHHKADLINFLQKHYMAGDEAEAITGMLFTQASTPPRFQNECSRCHKTAAEFVRQTLQFKNGVLYGSASGQRLADFLKGHRKLKAVDVEFFDNILNRVATEVYRPQ